MSSGRRAAVHLQKGIEHLIVLCGAVLLVGCGQPETIVVTPASTARGAAPTPTISPSDPLPAGALTGGAPTVTPSPQTVEEAPKECTFVEGFASMRALLGPDVIGECLENEGHVPGNGNAVQQTARGALVYRAADGQIAFTDGFQTWISSPEGLVTRPNDERFSWEADRQMVEALRAGGYAVYFYHGATDPTTDDTDHTNIASCATQRSLSDGGRAQARAIGESFRRLSIPVGRVLTSQDCRTIEYGRLAFGSAEVANALNVPDPRSRAEQDNYVTELRNLLGPGPLAQTNTVLIGDSANIQNAAGIDLPMEGAAAVLRADNPGEARLVMRVAPDDWIELSRALAER